MPKKPPPGYRRWVCPSCRKAFGIKESQRDPESCPNCGAEQESRVVFAETSPPPEPVVWAPKPSWNPPSVPEPKASLDAGKAAKKNRVALFVILTAVGGLGLLILAALSVWWFASNKPVDLQALHRPVDGTSESEELEAQAYAAACLMVTEYLVAPKTANFPPAGGIRRLGDGSESRFQIASYVDAKNPLGVPLRKKWRVILYLDPEKDAWLAEDIEIGGKVAYTRSEGAPKWLDGGTIYGKTIREWQLASPKDKLATCGGYVARVWVNGDFIPRIQNSVKSADDLKPYAQELVDHLDGYDEKFAREPIRDLVVLEMIFMEWLRYPEPADEDRP